MLGLTELAKSHLEDALRLGYIKLETGVVLDLTVAQILAVAKYVLKEGVAGEYSSEEESVPAEFTIGSEIPKLRLGSTCTTILYKPERS